MLPNPTVVTAEPDLKVWGAHCSTYPPTAQSGHNAATPHTPDPSFPLLCQGCCFGYLNKKKVELELSCFWNLYWELGLMKKRKRDRELEWKQSVTSRGKLRPGFRANCELSRVGQQSPVTLVAGAGSMGRGAPLGVES